MRVTSFLALFLAAITFAHADLMKGLTPADQKKIKDGGQLMLTENLDGYPWPRITIFQAVKATPIEVMAVFTDYNNATKFVPNCLKSEVAKKMSPLECDVDYVIDVPILADEAYTVRNTLSKDADALCVKWKILKATSILESQGSLYVEPLGDGSVLRYTNLVKPSSKAAMLLKGMAMGQMRDTVQAIVDRVDEQKASSGALAPQIQKIRAALGE